MGKKKEKAKTYVNKIEYDSESGEIKGFDEEIAYYIELLFEHVLVCKAQTAHKVKYFFSPLMIDTVKENPTINAMFLGARSCKFNSHCKYLSMEKTPNEYCLDCIYFIPNAEKRFNMHDSFLEKTDKFVPFNPETDYPNEPEEESTWRNYRDYLKTTYWKEFRLKAIEHYLNKCSWCGADGENTKMHVHHINYKNLGNETYDDVVLLCRDCHSKAHGKFKTVSNK